MKDSMRLVSPAPTAFESMLLEAARNETPEAVLEQRMLAPLATMGLAATTGAQATTSHAASNSGWLTWGACGMGLASAGLVAWLAVANGPARERPAFAATPQPTVALAAAPTAVPAEKLPASIERTPENRPRSRAASTANPRGGSNSLQDELSLLARSRQALNEGQPQVASNFLRLYEQRHPSGQLRQEATVLRVQALTARGQSEQANELAAEFLRLHPESAHAPRVERR